MKGYKFVLTAMEEKPSNSTIDLIEKADTDEKLTREEKDALADRLIRGMLGSSNGAFYCLRGWQWDVKEARQIRRILVRYKGESTFSVYYAPDKTSLRSVVPLPIAEMIYADGGS